ncbi:hypothetical protein B0H15DRAFT_806432 [Mycena belliarum]|uniref:Uncharacterized protein n=1 Tax=Mycena belliarum TaxID=1033014 RepID=A0AAD6XJ24_9AGAR|nr:hypothetical protein B0H15DRAFT_806432 [Mycena belliae]
MPKRKRVPQALHRELTGYADLLRVLRTNDALDLAKHITKPQPQPQRDRDRGRGQGSSTKAAQGSSPKAAQGSSPKAPAGAHPAEDADEDADKRPPKRLRKRDTWTRWPLLPHDVHVPEWGLADEVAALVRHCRLTTNTNTNPNASPRPRPALDDPADAPAPAPGALAAELEDPSADADDAPYLPPLTHAASDFLAALLALMAHHTPARPQSMQSRLRPVGWRSVLDVLGACGGAAVDATMLGNVTARLEAIYGPYEGHALARIATRSAPYPTPRPDAIELERTSLDKADAALFRVVRPPVREPKRTKPRADERDIDSEDLDG